MVARIAAWLTLTLFTAASLIACTQNDAPVAQEPHQAGAAAQPADPGMAVPQAGEEGFKPHPMADAISPGKPGAPVELRYSLQGRPLAGRQLDIAIEVTPRVATDELRLMASTPEGLVLGNIYPQVIFRDLQAGERNAHSLAVIPQRDGFFYVNLIATLNTASGPRSRPFSIPVVVGDVEIEPGLKPRGQLKTDERGEAVISLPADEPPDN